MNFQDSVSVYLQSKLYKHMLVGFLAGFGLEASSRGLCWQEQTTLGLSAYSLFLLLGFLWRPEVIIIYTYIQGNSTVRISLEPCNDNYLYRESLST